MIPLLTFLYTISGVVTFLGFFPTMRDLWNGHPSANIHTYFIWTTTTAIASSYGFFVLQDLFFNLVINLQLLACIAILGLRIRLLYKKEK